VTAAVSLSPFEGFWLPVKRTDVRARRLADRHYSRQTIGARDFMGPGRTLVLVTADARAVWGVLENLDPRGRRRWRCSIFRNEGPVRSSDLVREATARTFAHWRDHYGALPDVPLTTEVDASAVRAKRDPGRCFLRAGWTRRPGVGASRRALVVLEASEVPS
jgi:hypothetical protein